MRSEEPGVWFPAIRAGTGADVFTMRLAEGLRARAIRAEITWLPHRTEYAPWTVSVPSAPEWATVAHVNTWLPLRFLPPGLPLVATLHHCVQDAALAPYKSRAQQLYHRLWITPRERAVLNRVERLVAVSRYTAHRAQRIFGTRDIEVIPNGLDTEIFRPDLQPGTPHNPFRLLFVGSFSKRKGADLLAPVMETLGADYELWVVAEDGARRARLPANARLLPRRSGPEELAELYRHCDALLFPTRLEGFGLVAAEAQACGLPVIASRGSSLPEVVEDGVTGLLCPQDDVAAFASAARALATDTDRWRKLGIGGRVRAERCFALRVMVDRYLDVYRAVAGKASAPSPGPR